LNFVEHKQTHEANDFIRGWYIDTTICDNLIDYFESSDQKVAGTGSHGLDETQKKSTDVVLQDPTLYEAYGVEIQKVFEEYMKIYPFVNEYWPWGIVEEINLQRYYPGEGFYRWHTERTGLEDSNRHLVFMTYLNDVADAGETEFLHQNTKVKPEKGLTLVWPADWTFTHRGCVSKTETKYILTGWASYYNKIGN
jgi:prolyl 4-hydroxylase